MRTTRVPAAAVPVVIGVIVFIVVMGASTLRGLADPQSPSVDGVLAAAAGYLDEYERAFAAVVSEEHYAQYVREFTRLERRDLQSDFILLNADEVGWLGFRDVYEVDGVPVRDRSERLQTLFMSPGSDALLGAAAVAAESARFNLGAINRNVNVPTFALSYLRREAQPRSRFSLSGQDRVRDVSTVVLRFEERARPAVIRTTDGAPASGRFWIDPDSGRVVRTQLVIDSRSVRATFDVEYAPQEKLDRLWVPVQMKEHYQVSATRVIDGTATYGNFRRFSVETGTVLRRCAAPPCD